MHEGASGTSKKKKKEAKKLESLCVWFRGQGLGLEGLLKRPWVRAIVLVQEQILYGVEHKIPLHPVDLAGR